MSESLAYLEPLKAEMQKVESEIEEAEERLRELRKKRTGLGRGLAALDPHWSASNNYKGKHKSKTKLHGASQTRLDEVTRWLRANNPSETFSNDEISEGTGIHVTTIARVTRQLHETGVIRLDHMGGVRQTQKRFRLVTATDA